MEIKSTPWLRLVSWLLLLVAAFAAGRWQGLATRGRTSLLSSAITPEKVQSSARPEEAFTSVDQVIAAARDLPQPDARITTFFETLTTDTVAGVTEELHQMPASLHDDSLFLFAMRRWGELAAPAAITHADTVENLPLRASARAAVYEAWGRMDPAAAFAAASAETRNSDRERALTAVLAGAAVASAENAVAQWERTTEAFRASTTGHLALARIAEAACDGGQREGLQAIIARLPSGDERMLLTAAVARQWSRQEPEAAVMWLKTVTPSGAMQDGIIDEVFSVFVRKDPVRAAEWAARQADERRRSNYVAAAVAEWATYDNARAETWVNEQEGGVYLDGATSVIAAHFIEHRYWPQAFAWTRRILRNEARADLLGNLGHIWNAERPDEFTAFLAQTSLNRAEREMLSSKIVKAESP